MLVKQRIFIESFHGSANCFRRTILRMLLSLALPQITE